MAQKFTFNGKTYDTGKRGKGQSEREYVASITGAKNLKEAESWLKKNGSGGSSKDSKSSNSYKDIVQQVLGATPAQQPTIDNFEKTYTADLQAEDMAQSEALYKPYFEQQIANELEDLNAWSEAESVSYDRSLRRARFSLAASGGAIGSERTTAEGDMATDEKAKVDNTVRGYERSIGTDAIVNGGFQSAGQTQEGDIVGKMKTAVQEGQLWYKNQRAQRYMGNSDNYYQQPSAYALDGSKL